MIYRIVCIILLINWVVIISPAQVVKPKKLPQDSLQQKVNPPSQTDVDHLLDSLRNIKQTPAIPDLSPPEKDPFVKKITTAVKEQLPTLTEIDTKLKLRLRFPWREDILIPLPKALKQASGRPPYDPDIAYQRSLIIPGWGQAYNRSYWKMPIFYAGYGGFIWWINYNNQQYQRHGIAYRCAIGTIEGCVLDPEFASLTLREFVPDGINSDEIGTTLLS
ncbi:MAG: DUF5683 domain-containing protein [Bacteroidia bacterium]